MGIYGMGKAFNLRYANSGQYRATHVKRPPARPMCGGHAVSFTENTNVTIKNGPSGFWGFLGGLFGGLFGGGMGGGMSMGMGMPMGMPMGGMSPFGMLNTQMSQVTPQKQNGDRLADLQKMYPDWNITSDGNGKYDAVNKDQTVHHSGNFDEMCQKLLKEKQGAGSTPGTSTPGSSTPETSTPGSSTPGTSTPGSSTPGTSTPGSSTPASASHANEPQGAGRTGKKVNVPEGWYRADTNSSEGKSLNLKSCTSANAVLNKLLNHKMDMLSDTDRAALCKELIKANPSVFNSDGTVKANANFDKLDIPSINYIKQKYTGNITYNKTAGTGTYKSKATGETVTQNSTMQGAGGRTIKGKNGYSVQISNSGNIYFDNKGNKISADEFKKACPSIYASVTKASAQTTNTTQTSVANHPANNGKTHVGSRQPWL